MTTIPYHELYLHVNTLLSLNVHTHTHVHILSYFYLYAVYICLYDLDPKYCTICPDCEYICMYT